MYRGFIVGQTETTITVISERDKQFHILNKTNGVPIGATVMPDGHICNIACHVFNASKLYSACREYASALERHKKRREKKKLV